MTFFLPIIDGVNFKSLVKIQRANHMTVVVLNNSETWIVVMR